MISNFNEITLDNLTLYGHQNSMELFWMQPDISHFQTCLQKAAEGEKLSALPIQFIVDVWNALLVKVVNLKQYHMYYAWCPWAP